MCVCVCGGGGGGIIIIHPTHAVIDYYNKKHLLPCKACYNRLLQPNIIQANLVFLCNYSSPHLHMCLLDSRNIKIPIVLSASTNFT